MPAPQEMSVQVPEGLASGQQFTVAAPDGQQISVTVPPGVAGGAVIQVGGEMPAVPLFRRGRSTCGVHAVARCPLGRRPSCLFRAHR